MLQKYPYQYGSLAVINGQLTAIGGCMNMFTEGYLHQQAAQST